MPLLHTVRDNFNDNVRDTSIWSDYAAGGTISETGNRVTVSLDSNVGVYISSTTVGVFDLENSYAKLDVLELPNQAGGMSQTLLFLQNNLGSVDYYWSVDSGVLKAFWNDTVVASLTYNSTTHRQWRIRHSGSTIYWDTSADGLTWSQRGQVAQAGDISQFYAIVLTNIASPGIASPGVFTYDNFNVASYLPSITGTISFFDVNTRPKIRMFREAEGTLTFSGTVSGFYLGNNADIEKKTFLYKVYDPDNNFLGVLDDVIDYPNWSPELNTTGSSTTVLLARNSDSLVQEFEALQDNASASILDNDNFEILTSSQSRNKVGPGSIVNHNNRVDIYAYYGYIDTILDNLEGEIQDNNGDALQGSVGAPNGIRRFSGFISEININYGNTENTQIELLSYGFDLDQYPVTDGLGNTTVTYTSFDPGNIVKDGLDQFDADSTGTFTTYTSATVALTGTTASYPFRVNTYKELLEISVKLAPEGWFYYVGLGDNLVRFRERPATPDHIFYLGKHIKNLNLRSYIGDVVNDVLFTGGGDPALYKRYTVAPVSGTRRGLSRMSDSRVELASSADLLGQGEIDEKKNIQYRSTVEILDKTYDIETIECGQLITFRNFDNNVDLISMLVVGYNYTPDTITLALDTLPPSVPKRLSELRKALSAQETQYAGSTPDV